MVFLTTVNLMRGMRKCLGNRGPDRFWRRRRMMSLSGHMYARARNCWKFAVKGVLRSLKNCTYGRQLKRKDIRELQDLRINSAASEHGLNRLYLVEGIQRNLIVLDRKILSDLAIWEPRTFKALTDVSKAKLWEDGDLPYPGMNKEDVSHFVRRDMLREDQ